LTELQARPVELWLTSLDLSPKIRSHIRGLLHSLWDFAMWRGDVPVQRNPIELVTVKDASKRMRQPRSLTVDENQKFAQHLEEPFRTISLLCVCLGLRISEALGLKWSDVDWKKSTLAVTRAIVYQQVDDCKSAGSRKTVAIAAEVLDALKTWKQASQFSSSEDWMFASPVQLGRLPWSFNGVQERYQKAGKDAGIGHLSTHTMRHTFRSWLDATGATVAVQQKAMRHADVRTTMNTYGDVVTDELVTAGSKVAALAVNGRESAGAAS
jgi:integrase